MRRENDVLEAAMAEVHSVQQDARARQEVRVRHNPCDINIELLMHPTDRQRSCAERYATKERRVAC